jgi:hypothetical protein
MCICISESNNKCASLSCLQDQSKLRKKEIVSSFLTEILLALKEVMEILSPFRIIRCSSLFRNDTYLDTF